MRPNPSLLTRVIPLATIMVLASAGIGARCTVLAGPNLVAHGDLEFPQTRAEGRIGRAGNSAVFEFPGDMHFGRVIATGNNVGRELAEQLVVAYTYLTASSGKTRGLMISATDVKVNEPYEIAVWFNLEGKIRPGKQYAYAVLALAPGGNQKVPPLEMVVPAIWADGQLAGARVNLEWTEADKSQDELIKRGIIQTPQFERETGGQALVMKLPSSFKGQLFLEHVSLREIDEALLNNKGSRMPQPIRYIEIEDPIERRITEALDVGSRHMMQDPGFWPVEGSTGDPTLTAATLSTLGNLGEDLTTERMKTAIDWLARQELETVPAVAARLNFLARYGLPDHRQQVAADLMWLSAAQFEDGGWAEQTGEDLEDRTVHPDNLNSLRAVLALREAHYAGLEANPRIWRRAVRYWTDAQARDGGFRHMKDEYGGFTQATTTHMTACGLTGLFATLDMAFAAGGNRCSQYMVNREQVGGILDALDWLDQFYDERFKEIPRFGQPAEPFLNAEMMQHATELTGITRLHDKDVFRNEAKIVLGQFDVQTGLVNGDPTLTTRVLDMLSRGAAPIVLQRIIVGGTRENECSRDCDHFTRYLRAHRRKPLNWRATTIETPIRELVTVPMLFVNVVGPIDWNEKQWSKIRDYCFDGGVVVFNVDEGVESQRVTLLDALKNAFPEYALADLPADDPVLSITHKIADPPKVKVLGNGFKNFVYVTPRDWSCWLNLYSMEEHAGVFEFMANLLDYTLDGDEPRSSFAVSTWDPGAGTTMQMKMARMEVGGALPAWPDLPKALDRTMQSGYRLKVDFVRADSAADKPVLLWLACTGDKPMSEEQRRAVRHQLDAGTFLFAEVVSGREGWLEAFSADLQKVDDGLHIRQMLANHPVMTGQVEETQGYDLRRAAVRAALRDEDEVRPRPDMYVIEKNGKEIGVLSAYDISSGIGYNLYPGCRGLMPRESREMAANVLLYALERRTSEPDAAGWTGALRSSP